MKTALVTGASRGLGNGFVRELLKKGFIVFAGAKTLDVTLPARENLVWVELDVRDNETIQKAAKMVAGKTTTLDILVNNAGINRITGTDERKLRVSCEQSGVQHDDVVEPL